jgi:hypothetical protein
MKEKLYTIPLNDAVNADDECPFCFVERAVEQDLLDFVLGAGASYMERDVRDITDREGFCRAHWKKMFDYGNALGNAWILKTHYLRFMGEMKSEFKKFSSRKGKNSLAQWVQEKEGSCYICRSFAETYERYLETYLVMYKSDADFRAKIAQSKGFCLKHFGDLCAASEKKLNEREKGEFFPVLFKLMEENTERMFGDVAWFIEKFDYRNQDADWKNSRDALQRAMQKIKGGYPADPVYKKDR